MARVAAGGFQEVETPDGGLVYTQEAFGDWIQQVLLRYQERYDLSGVPRDSLRILRGLSRSSLSHDIWIESAGERLAEGTVTFCRRTSYRLGPSYAVVLRPRGEQVRLRQGNP